ncbi:MAG: hypothetical protein ACPG32_01185 [Akkermansiaceae bacterium]
MAANRKNKGRKQRRQGGYNRLRARTERLHVGVRLGLCLLALMLACAFMVAALPEHKKLQKSRSDLAEVQQQEQDTLERTDAKKRELRAIINDSRFRGMIARDRLDYYIPGEHIFRIER